MSGLDPLFIDPIEPIEPTDQLKHYVLLEDLDAVLDYLEKNKPDYLLVKEALEIVIQLKQNL